MLNFISPHLAINYFLLAFVTIVGALQFIAARHRLTGLTLLGRDRKPIWGYLLAIVLIVVPFVWFFATTPEVFEPGLAGSELVLLFGAAGICAVTFTLLVSSILHEAQNREGLGPRHGRLRHEAVAWQQLKGTLYLPEDATLPEGPWSSGPVIGPDRTEGPRTEGEPRAAICVLPSPSEEVFSPHPLVADLLEEGFIVLAMDWGRKEEIRYPAVLGLLPSAVAYLLRRDEVNPERIGVLGVDLGGDLAVRSAATDQQIAAVLALAPFLDQTNTQPGLTILQETSFLGAIRWAGFRRRGKLVAELAALDYLSKLGSRPLLLIYGEQDGITPAEGGRAALGGGVGSGKLKLVPGEGHLSLPRNPTTSAQVSRWFKENL